MDLGGVLSDNLNYFENNHQLFKELENVEKNYKELLKVSSEVESFCGQYDYDENVKGNGYRSLVDISKLHILKTKEVCTQLILNREKMFFNKNKFMRKLKRCNVAMETTKRLGQCMIDNRGNSETLFRDVGNLDNELTKFYKTVDLVEGIKAHNDIKFKSIRDMNYGIMVSLSAHSKCYFANQRLITNFFYFIFYFFYYFCNWTAACKKTMEIFTNAGVIYFQEGFRVYENMLLKTFGDFMEPKVEVTKQNKIKVENFDIPDENDEKMIKVPLPACETIEYYLYKNKNITKLSKYLIFNIHGGGFIAQSPKTHASYLKQFAIDLDCSIVSVNYSLSPQHAHPLALDQSFYTYCYALKHPEEFGWTGEKVVFVGDSAGANLITCCTTKCIETGVRKPNGILPIYGVFLPRHGFVPSRFLSFFDANLAHNLYLRIFSAYRGYQEQPTMLDENGNIKMVEIGPSDEKFERNHLVTPYYTPHSILKKFPPTIIISTNFDPCLDECVEMAKLMKKCEANIQLEILPNLPHSFLALSYFSPECREGYMVCVKRIRELFQIVYE